MFKRKIYKKMIEWKKDAKGTNALLIEGARRVGKTTVVREFAKNEYESYIFIDFSHVSSSIKELFEDLSNLNYLFMKLQLEFKTDLFERKSVIVFDEVQLCPKARQAIKALVEDGRYDYIETGSLISIKKNVKDILIPSEEHRIDMHPLDYEEFLLAIGDTTTFGILEDAFNNNISLDNHQNRIQLRLFRLYMLVGGMPQAVEAYIESNNLRIVDNAKRDILDLYESDFQKIDSTGRLSKIYDAIPAQLNNNAFRFQAASITGTKGQDRILSMISEIEDSKTVLVSHNVNDPNIGLAGSVSANSFKLFIADTGLFVTLMFKDKDFTENVIYEKLLNDKLSANLGYLYENVVAQCLASNGYKLFYHTMQDKKKKRNYEIDFLLSYKNKIIPIEVKSSSYKTHASLDLFKTKFSSRIIDSYLVFSKEYCKDRDINCIPFYYVPYL